MLIFFIILVYINQSLMSAGFAQRTFIPYAETFGDSFVQGRVDRVDIEGQMVILQGGKVRKLHLTVFVNS